MTQMYVPVIPRTPVIVVTLARSYLVLMERSLLICTNQAQGQSSSVQIQDQITNRECVLSSGTCTRADVLLDDTGEVICDPSLGLECSTSCFL